MTEEIKSFRPENQHCTVYYKIVNAGTNQAKAEVVDVIFDFVDSVDYEWAKVI